MLSPRRILMSVDAVGGVWTYALDLAQGLAALGIETTLLGFGPRPTAEQQRAALRVADLDWSDLPLDWTGAEDRLADVPARVAEAAIDAGADVIQVNQPSQAAELDTDRPVVAVSHSCLATWFRVVRGSPPPKDWARRSELTARGLRAADAVVAPSRAHARLMTACYPGLGDVSVVPNATPLRPEPATRRAYAYAAARWWDDGKNAVTLDAAAAETSLPVLAAGATAGPAGERVRFRHVRALGQIGRERMDALSAEAAVFVSPSLYEPFGLAVLEAAAAGAALVLADIPTYRELWDGAALFADPADPAAFAAAMDALHKDPTRRRALSCEARSRAARYSPETQAASMAALYRTVTQPLAEQAV